MSSLRTYLLRVHKHQLLPARSSFLSKLDEISAGMLITYHFYKIPRNVCNSVIIVVEGQACDKTIDYFRAIEAGTEVYRS